MNVVVGKVLSVSPTPKKNDKLNCVSLDVGQEEPISVVTNAPNIAPRTVGKHVVVALVGAEVDGLVVARRSVGGIMSEGMLMDSQALGWSGGANGIAALVPESFPPGSDPPTSRPRMDGASGGNVSSPSPAAAAAEPIFEKKQTKEERKAQAKAAREAKKLNKKKKTTEASSKMQDDTTKRDSQQSTESLGTEPPISNSLAPSVPPTQTESLPRDSVPDQTCIEDTSGQPAAAKDGGLGESEKLDASPSTDDSAVLMTSVFGKKKKKGKK